MVARRIIYSADRIYGHWIFGQYSAGPNWGPNSISTKPWTIHPIWTVSELNEPLSWRRRGRGRRRAWRSRGRWGACDGCALPFRRLRLVLVRRKSPPGRKSIDDRAKAYNLKTLSAVFCNSFFRVCINTTRHRFFSCPWLPNTSQSSCVRKTCPFNTR